MKNKYRIAVFGLGYVGLPLAHEFSKKFITYGFDNSIKRINQIKNNLDINDQLSKYDLKKSKVILTTKKINYRVLIFLLLLFQRQ